MKGNEDDSNTYRRRSLTHPTINNRAVYQQTHYHQAASVLPSSFRYPSPIRPVNHYPNYKNKLLHNPTEPSTTPQTKPKSGGKLRLQNRNKANNKEQGQLENDFTPHTYADNKNES
jgi:hypothetical protein